MCQLCDEADAYLAQVEAAAKKRAEEQRKQASRSADEGKRVASEAPHGRRRQLSAAKRAMMLILAALAASPSAAAESSPAEALKGCWQPPDTTVTYCFDVEVAGEFVTRAAGGDGWDGGGHYTIDGDRLRMDEGEGRTCTFGVSGDVLTLSQCTADQTVVASEPIEDETWGRVPQ
jgi:hypothetical protein